MRVKICGITTPAEIGLLNSLPVDMVGLWHGVPGGRAELSVTGLGQLADAAVATGRLVPVLVTLRNDVAKLRAAIAGSALRWIQLHGYQAPSVVRALKDGSPDAVVVKVLHVQGESCVEEPLIPAYQRAGVDIFLFDTVTAEGRLGSTGLALPGAVVRSFLDRLARPFLIAGGVNMGNWRDHLPSVRHRQFLGIDVDTNARGPDGRLDPHRVLDICQAWRVGERDHEHANEGAITP
jgi:phosphoribosylanthranilate isomerase